MRKNYLYTVCAIEFNEGKIIIFEFRQCKPEKGENKNKYHPQQEKDSDSLVDPAGFNRGRCFEQ